MKESKPQIFKNDLPCFCYGPDYDCLCGQEEKTLRHYAYGNYKEPMTKKQRQWCINEAIWAGEGYYKKEELNKMLDKDLAYATINAWGMYAKSHY